MSARYQGGVISKTAPTPSGPYQNSTATGMWTMEQAAYWIKQGNWPTQGNIQTYKLFSWGRNYWGQLGLGDSGAYTNRSSPTQVGSLTTWALAYAANYSSLATPSDSSLKTWGRNNNGQLGLNNTTSYFSPMQVGALTTWSKVGGSKFQPYANTAFAIKTDGTLWAWGRNEFGQLGLGNATYYSSPKQVGALTTWLNIVSTYASTGAIKTDGTLWTWGLGNNGMLGLGNVTHYSSPKQVGSLTTWASISAGANHMLAITTDGTLWAWGSNSSGKLGIDLGGGSRSSPVQVGALTNWLAACGAADSSFAIKTDGTLWAWGGNNVGQLGLGNITYYSSPKQVGALTTWSKVVAGRIHTGAIRTNGTLWTWGYNPYGQLGLGNVTNYSSPKQVGSLTTWHDISMGHDFALALVNN